MNYLRIIVLSIALGAAPFAYAHPGHDHGASSTDSLGVTVEGVSPIEAGIDASVDVTAGSSTSMEHMDAGDDHDHAGEAELGVSARVAEGGLSETEKQSLITLDSQGILMIKTDADVATYAELVAEESPEVDAITVTENRISVTYVDEGKLFGFIPMGAKGTASVDTTGGVQVDGPWYGFMMSGLADSEIQTQLASELSGRGEATKAAFSSSTEVALQARAEIVHTITHAIEASLASETEVAAE